ncbi:MAG: type I restriction-modification system subunit M [Roseburia sp.]
MNKQQLAARIWESSNKMRSKIEANEYKDYILGFIFYKFLSEKEVKYLKENDWTDEYLSELTEEDTETVESIQKNLGYFISYENLFSTWLEKDRDFSVQNVRDALSAFSRLINPAHKKVFEGVFDTLQTGLSKLGDSAASQSKSISDLIQLIRDIPMDGKQGYDVLGFIYEYLIEKFAANAGKKAGEFYTPHEVSLLMSEIVANHLKDRDKIEIYDPTSGSGSLLINIGKSASKYISGENKVKYYAQELKQNTYNLTRMNLVMRGIEADNIVTRNGDTLEDDWPYFDENDPIGSYNPLYVDAVVSNPPYSQAWNPVDKETDPRYAGYGIAPKGKADYAFLLHDLYHIKPDGIMTIVLPHGVLFRGGEEGEIRKNLIEKNKIDTIIGLPANIFYGTGIPTIIMVLKQKRINNDILIIDASKGFTKDGKNNKLRASDIKRIVDVVTARESVCKFSRVVSRDEIRKNDYNLNIPRYVDSSEEAESWDIYASMFGGLPISEIDKLDKYWKAFPLLREELFENSSKGYCQLAGDDIKKSIKEHSNVKSFEKNFQKAFQSFDKYLYDKLIVNINESSILKSEEVLSGEMFKRLEDIPLIDKYEAYQLLDDDWTEIAVDLEIIQTEGTEAIKKVDPLMVTKKKGGKEQEVQDGWKGHIIPFELVQNTILSEEKERIKDKENRLSEIASEYEEIFDSLTEEEKGFDFVSEDGWVISEVKRALKSDSIELETKEKLETIAKINDEEKSLKAEIKTKSASLETKTKDIIENLSDEQASELLKAKWINPLIQNIMQLPDRIIKELVANIELLEKKYETTFEEIENEITETEKVISGMIDELEGSESDMLGLKELKKLLGGIQNDERKW